LFLEYVSCAFDYLTADFGQPIGRMRFWYCKRLRFVFENYYVYDAHIFCLDFYGYDGDQFCFLGDDMLAFLKKFYVFMLILMVFSYLVPKDEYKKYIQFFIGIFIVVLFLKPVLEFFTIDNPWKVYEVFDSFNEQINKLEVELEEGENIYEYFFYKGEGE
jgi:stage III sporulation protein AF